MFSDTKFWRLVWKEYRAQRALWLTLLIGVPALQAALMLLAWTSGAFRPQELYDQHRMPNLVIGYLALAFYVLGCGATLFSVEHETGMFDFQRVLPANQPRVFWAKIAFVLMSSLGLALTLTIITRVVFVSSLPKEASWFVDFGGLLLIEMFVWSVLCSLLIKHPLWGVIAALFVQSTFTNVVLPSVAQLDPNIDRWAGADERLTSWRLVLIGVLAAADIVLGKLWYEDRLRLPRWRFRWRRDITPSYPSSAELPAFVGEHQVGWSRMLWLSWRDGRWLIAGFLAWFGNDFYELHHLHNWESLALPGYIGSFVIGLLAFVPEQWGGRLRYMAERGCSPRKAWLCRQLICLPPVLLICGAMAWMHSFEPVRDPRYGWNAAHRAMMAQFGPLLCYSAGQLAAMLFRRTALAIAVGLVLAMLGFFWGHGMSSWLAPLWWSVGSLPVIGLFVTWLKANDWVEERRDRVARWRLAMGMGIPIFLLLATCATYRVVQIPVVQLPVEWDAPDRTEAQLSVAEKETLELYRRAYAEQVKTESQHTATHEARRRAIQQAHPEWDANKFNNEAFKTGHKQWLAAMAPVIALLTEAHSRPAVALEFLNHEPSRRAIPSWDSDAWSDFSALLRELARDQVAQGDLDGAWQTIEIEWELIRRAQLRVTASNVDPIAAHEEWLLEVIASWGRRAEQSRDRILKAIRRLEVVAQQDVSKYEIHRQLATALPLVEDLERWREHVRWRYNQPLEYGAATAWWIQWRLLPWERWRFQRKLRRQAFFSVSNADGLQRQLESHQPLSLVHLNVDLGPYPHERSLLEDTTLPPDMQGGFQLVMFNQFAGRAEAFRATILRLALADWLREHGRYPSSLSELVPTYFAEVPLDPISAGEFVYFPRGVTDDVSNGLLGNENVLYVKTKVPFLVTSGGVVGSWRRSQQQEGSWEFTNSEGKPVDLLSALRAARVWVLEPIPTAPAP